MQVLEYSLLRDPVFAVCGGPVVDGPRGRGASRSLTLPETLAALAAGDALDFVNLRPHQAHAWHAFLVQLAYLALRPDGAAPPAAASEWRDRLLVLTDQDEGAWHLVVSDWKRPAFLQPPCPDARISDFKLSVESAQDLDVLVTSRHHDEKREKLRLTRDTLDVLAYALVSVQGWSAFAGKGNYGSMRMNGGYGSRPQFRLAYERGSGAEFRRDLDALLDARATIEQSVATGAHALLWLVPWDGSASLALESLHPLCLEVCRRLRVTITGQGLRVMRAGSAVMRVAAKDSRGVVNDPWIPIVKDGEPRALTAQAHSFGFRTLPGLVFDSARTQLPLLAMPSAAERRSRRGQPATLIAQVLVGGDGRTEGFLRRELLLPPAVVSRFGGQGERAELALRAARYVEIAGKVIGSAWRPALMQFVQGADDVDWKKPDVAKAIEPAVAAFERHVDDVFFDHLFAGFERDAGDLDAQHDWAAWLSRQAREQLPRVIDGLPTRDDTRLFARVRATRMLDRGLRKQLGDLLATADDRAEVSMAAQPT